MAGKLDMMTQEEQRLWIAKWCGLESNGFGGFYPPNLPPLANIAHNYELPDYHNDLNAMWQAEQKLTDNQYQEFCENLRTVCFNAISHIRPLPKIYRPHSSSAPQRLEALCRTLWPERWKE